MSKIDVKKYLENLEQENLNLKNENALLKRQLQSANDRAKKNEEAANGQEFGVPELFRITRQLSHYADLVQSQTKLSQPNYPNQTIPTKLSQTKLYQPNYPNQAVFKKPLASKSSIIEKNQNEKKAL